MSNTPHLSPSERLKMATEANKALLHTIGLLSDKVAIYENVLGTLEIDIVASDGSVTKVNALDYARGYHG